MSETPRCRAAVHKRDTYRYTGGKHRFQMHYTKEQCSRAAKEGDLCKQHSQRAKDGWNFERLDWHKFICR